MDNDFPSLYTPPASSGGLGGGAGTGASGSALPSSSISAGPSAGAGEGSSSYAVGAHLLKEIHEQSEGSGNAAVNGNANANGSRQQQGNRGLDLESESAFPSLGAPSAAFGNAPGSGWGAAARTRAAAVASTAAAPASQALFTESLTLPTASISVAPPPPSAARGGFSNKEPEPTTLGGVLIQLSKKYAGVKVESSTSTAKGTTTLLIKAQRQQDVERVKRDLLARIVKKVSETLQVPASTRAFIIGSKGKNLKAITEETGVNIQIPREGGQAAAPASDEPEYAGEEAEDPLIAINLYGDMPSVAQAKQRILAIVNERTSRTSTKVTTVPLEFYHLLSAKHDRGEVINEADAASVDIRIPPVWKFRAGQGRGASAGSAGADGEESNAAGKDERDTAISLVGDREAVSRAVEAITAAADELARTTQTLSMTLSKRQHRFILPPASDEILAATACAVEVPPASNPSDQITIRGPSANLVSALTKVMEKANAASVDVVDLASIHGIATPASYPRAVARYLLAKAKLRKIADEEGVQIFIPRANDPHTTVDIVATTGPNGHAAAVANARGRVLEVLKVLPPSSFDNVEVEPLLHRFLIGKKGARIQTFEEKNQVQIIFPPQSAQGNDITEDRQVLLVFIGSDTSSAHQTLKTVKEEILKLAKDAADITSTTLQIPAKLHRHIIGPSGTTLNALIGTGDERVVHVRFGSSSLPKQNGDAGSKSDIAEDEVVIRGPSDEVKRVVKDIERVAEEAKNDEIVNSYTTEFDIEQRFVSHIVGKGGAGIQKLREDLGVRVDISEPSSSSSAANESTVVKGKKSKPASQSHVKIQGRKENVEEAKKRIHRQIEQLADETTLTVNIPAGLERGALIGKQGAYVQRLESKYAVRINFPRGDNEDGERDNAITVRGGKKGADGAKKELLELMDYEKEHNQSASVYVPGRALPRIFGRQGASIRELQEETGAEIDVNRKDPENPGSDATFVIRGTKNAIAQAKKAITAIISEVQDEVTFEVPVERSMHSSIVGKGGQNIRDIIARCGGPSDSRAAAQLVRFPRQGEEGDIVTVRGPSEIATKIKAELEKQSAAFKDRIVYAIAVPQSSHARLVGRGGAGVNELQRKHNVRILLSNWTEFRPAGQPVNSEDISGVADNDVVKIIGAKAACEAAAAEIKQKANAGQQSEAGRQQRQQAQEPIVKTVDVPAHLHSRVAQGGKFFRNLPGGIRIDHGDVKPPSSRPVQNGQQNGAAKAARIDADEEDEEDGFHWEVTPLTDIGADTTPIPWHIKGNDQAKVDRVEGLINEALERCETQTHQGVLTVPQSLIPRIVGRQGSGLDKLRALGVSAEVEGKQGANQVIFVGNPNDLESARESVLELSRNQKTRQY